VAQRSRYKIVSKAENSPVAESFITCRGASPGAGLVTGPGRWLRNPAKSMTNNLPLLAVLAVVIIIEGQSVVYLLRLAKIYFFGVMTIKIWLSSSLIDSTSL